MTESTRPSSTLQKNAEVLHTLYGLLDSDREPTDQDAMSLRYLYASSWQLYAPHLTMRSIRCLRAPPGIRDTVWSSLGSTHLLQIWADRYDHSNQIQNKIRTLKGYTYSSSTTQNPCWASHALTSSQDELNSVWIFILVQWQFPSWMDWMDLITVIVALFLLIWREEDPFIVNVLGNLMLVALSIFSYFFFPWFFEKVSSERSEKSCE